MIKVRDLTPLVLNPPPNITKVIDQETEDKLILFLENNLTIGFDVETTVTVDFFWRRLRTMQFGNSNEQYVIDLKAYCDGDADLLYKCQGNYGANLSHAEKLWRLIERLRKYLVTNEWLKVGVNLSFEYECLYWLLGVRAYGWYDCMLAEKSIYAGIGGHASLKNYDYFSMESMVERYFGNTIDKTLQTSFNLEDELTDGQWEYAALDTRLPLGIKHLQTIIANGETVKSLNAKGQVKLASYLSFLDPLILGDKLHEAIALENHAIGSFVDMHLHGERIDREAWITRTNKAQVKLDATIKNLDTVFLPIVGSKLTAIDEKEIEDLGIKWKTFNNITPEEAKIKAEISAYNRAIKQQIKNGVFIPELNNPVLALQAELGVLQAARLEQKEVLKKKHSDLKKMRTKINKLSADCEGEALINYGSDAQLLKILRDPENIEHFSKLFKAEKINGVKTGKYLSVLDNLDDDTLKEHELSYVIKLIREYHGLSKEVGTYGLAWAKEWTTKPCKEQGWLHPGDGRLHCDFNQYDAETGRSSSSKPNGQNLPQDKAVRSCFIADPPNEDIRISNCCDRDISYEPDGFGDFHFYCLKCGNECTTHAEEYVIITSDMSGAELRIIAEDSGDEQWISAFERGEDLHSSGTELLYESEWPLGRLSGCAFYNLHTEETVTKYPKATIGTPRKEKCSCPLHKELRDGTKACNFLLAYGGGPGTLAVNIGKTFKEAKALMALHAQKNPKVHAYLDASGKKAAMDHKAFDLFGRRRILPEPTTERAIENCKDWNEKELRLPADQAEKNINTFIQIKGRKPQGDEEFMCTHRPPTNDEISRSYFQMNSGLTRQGKNMRIQGTNASIAKVAMGSGKCQDGIPFLWHTLPKYRAKLIKFVHDELVIQAPKQYGEVVAQLVGDAFKRAGAIKMKKVVMEFDFNIASYWKK